MMDVYFEGLKTYLQTVRRDLHKIPESGMQEYKTSAYLREKLEELGLCVEQWLKQGFQWCSGSAAKRWLSVRIWMGCPLRSRKNRMLPAIAA